MWSLTTSPAIAAVVASVICISSCGGSGDGPTTNTPLTGSGGGETREAEQPSDQSTSTSSTAEGDEVDGGPEDQSAEGGDADRDSAAELPPRGDVSAQSSDFEKYSRKGKLHLAEFGSEGTDSERSEIDRLVDAYLAAIAKADWGEACSYLSVAVKDQLAELAARQRQGEDCAQALPEFLQAMVGPEGAAPISAPEGVASFRVQEGVGGFALFHGSDATDHWLALKPEDGEWKVLSIAPQPFL